MATDVAVALVPVAGAFPAAADPHALGKHRRHVPDQPLALGKHRRHLPDQPLALGALFGALLDGLDRVLRLRAPLRGRLGLGVTVGPVGRVDDVRRPEVATAGEGPGAVCRGAAFPGQAQKVVDPFAVGLHRVGGRAEAGAGRGVGRTAGTPHKGGRRQPGQDQGGDSSSHDAPG